MANKKKAAKTYADIMKDEFEKIIGDYDVVTNISWNGIEIEIKKYVGFDDVVYITESVYGDCCSEESGTFRPDIMDFSLRSAVVEKYTNFTLPGDTMVMYRLLYTTDLYDKISENISKSQIDGIVDVVNKRINMFSKKNAFASFAGAYEAVSTMKYMAGIFENLFSEISSDDIKAMTEFISNEGNIDERILRIFSKHKSAAENE